MKQTAMLGNTARILVLLLWSICVESFEDGVLRKRAQQLRAFTTHQAAALNQNKIAVKSNDIDDVSEDDDDTSVDADTSDDGEDEPVVVVDDPEEQDKRQHASTSKVLVAEMPTALSAHLQKAGPWNNTHVTMTVSGEFKCEHNKDHEYDSDVDHPEANVRCAELELLTNSVRDAEQVLQKKINEQQEIEVRLNAITDNEAAEAMIQGHETVVANETQSAGLAMFLGGYWREMRMFAKPFYKQHLQEKQEKLVREQKQLQIELDIAEDKLAAEKAKYKAEDEAEKARHAVSHATGEKKEEAELKAEEAEAEAEEAEAKSEELDARDDEDKKKAEKKEAKAKQDVGEAEEKEIRTEEKTGPKGARVVPGEKPVPMFTEKTMPAVSPTMYCVICLSWQYFLIFTVTEILKTVNQSANNAFAASERMFEQMKPTVTYAPMLCVLFLATRIRAIQLTKGQTEKYELPQPWVQACMYACTAAVAAQCVLVLLTTYVTGPPPQTRDQDGESVGPELDQIPPPVGAKVLSILYYLVLLAMYGGFAAVCLGAIIMPAPKDLWGDKPPPPSIALLAILVLSCSFLLVYLGFNVCNIIRKVYKTTRFGKTEYLFTKAKTSVNLSPMLSILFLSSRMRALQIDPEGGNQRSWVENSMLAASVGIATIVLVITIVHRFDKDVEEMRGTYDGEMCYEFKGTRKIVTVAQYGLLALVFGSAFAVMYSIYTIEDPRGPAFTPPVSPAVQCVVLLANMYFLVYTLLFFINSAKEAMMREQGPTLRHLEGMFDAGVSAVMFAPMLCMLFVGARMRALQITKTVDGQSPVGAGPQLWVQEAMYLATWSVILQVLMAYMAAYILGPGNADFLNEDGMQKTGIPTSIGRLLVVIHYCLHLCMYGGAVLVMAGVFSMTPETLPPYAARESLIRGEEVPPPPKPHF